jgi:hypothetical protein
VLSCDLPKLLVLDLVNELDDALSDKRCLIEESDCDVFIGFRSPEPEEIEILRGFRSPEPEDTDMLREFRSPEPVGIRGCCIELIDDLDDDEVGIDCLLRTECSSEKIGSSGASFLISGM